MGVLLLNGCSSAGKSTLAAILQERLDPPHLRFGIDDIFRMSPVRTHSIREGFYFEHLPDGAVHVRLGPFGRRALSAFHTAAAAMARAGIGVLVDDVIFDEGLRRDWLEALHDIDILIVGVHCALPELERRERARGDRIVGQARAQFDVVHAGMIYDLEIDTTAAAPAQCADKIEALYRANPAGAAKERLRRALFGA